MEDTTPPPPPPSGQNDGSAPLSRGASRADLAKIVALREPSESLETEVSPQPTTEVDPDAVPDPSTETVDGQETLLTDETLTEGEEKPAEGEPKEVLFQTGDAEADAAYAELNPDAVVHFAEMAKALAAGEVSIGELKRGYKLMDTVNELRRENEELKARPATVSASASTLPKAVAGLKTLQEVEARYEQAETAAEAIEDFLYKNPDGGVIGDKEYTRDQLIDMKRGWKDELKALPKRGQEIQQVAQFAQARTAASQQIAKDFPVLANAEHPDAKMARTFMKDPRFQADVNGDYIALCLATGHRIHQADLAKRKAGAAVTKAAARPVSKIPAGRPHVAATAAAKPGPGIPVADALAKIGKEGSRSSLSALLSATGR